MNPKNDSRSAIQKIPRLLWHPKVHYRVHKSLPMKYAVHTSNPISPTYVLILREIRKRKANWIGHILRRNCLLKQVIEGKIKGETEVTRRRGRRRKKLMDDLKDRRGYCHLKEEALDRTMWKNRFGRGFGPVVRQTAYGIR